MHSKIFQRTGVVMGLAFSLLAPSPAALAADHRRQEIEHFCKEYVQMSKSSLVPSILGAGAGGLLGAKGIQKLRSNYMKRELSEFAYTSELKDVTEFKVARAAVAEYADDLRKAPPSEQLRPDEPLREFEKRLFKNKTSLGMKGQSILEMEAALKTVSPTSSSAKKLKALIYLHESILSLTPRATASGMASVKGVIARADQVTLTLDKYLEYVTRNNDVSSSHQSTYRDSLIRKFNELKAPDTRDLKITSLKPGQNSDGATESARGELKLEHMHPNAPARYNAEIFMKNDHGLSNGFDAETESMRFSHGHGTKYYQGLKSGEMMPNDLIGGTRRSQMQWHKEHMNAAAAELEGRENLITSLIADVQSDRLSPTQAADILSQPLKRLKYSARIPPSLAGDPAALAAWQKYLAQEVRTQKGGYFGEILTEAKALEERKVFPMSGPAILGVAGIAVGLYNVFELEATRNAQEKIPDNFHALVNHYDLSSEVTECTLQLFDHPELYAELKQRVAQAKQSDQPQVSSSKESKKLSEPAKSKENAEKPQKASGL